MIRLVGLGTVAVAAAWLLLSAGPVFGQQSPNGTVTATVIANSGPCISVAPATFSYAAEQFSADSAIKTTIPTGSKPVVTNCSNQTSNFLAKGDHATGPSGTWTLHGAPQFCTSIGANKYRHEINKTDGTDPLVLTTIDQPWETSVPGNGSAGNTRILDSILTMPCTTSDGAGTTMSLHIFLTAVISGS
ncbi:MAG: hypothetical protein AB7R89_01975 [Dehalococcoidia bacterium]